MKKTVLEEGESLFREVELDQYGKCNGCGDLTLKKDLVIVLPSKGRLCPKCRKNVCTTCGESKEDES